MIQLQKGNVMFINMCIFLVIILIIMFIIVILFKKVGNKNNEFNKYFDRIYKSGRNNFNNELENYLINSEKKFIITANPETIMQSEKNEELRNAVLDENTIVIPDGVGILKGAKLLKYDIKETILGVDVANKLIELADKYHKRIFLFGAKREVLDLLQKFIHDKYSKCEIVGCVDGYVEDKDLVFEEMRKVNPDIVLVAIGIPKQEILIHKHLNEFDKGIFVGVGGSFDVISGYKKRAPKIFIKLKLEWLYRITKEPKRLKRFYESNIKYLMKIIF